jgi:hypothetical protein
MSASSLAPGAPSPNFFSPEPRWAFPAPRLPQIFPALLLLVLLLETGVGASALVAAESRITVDAGVKLNRSALFSGKTCFAGNGLWSQRDGLRRPVRCIFLNYRPLSRRQYRRPLSLGRRGRGSDDRAGTREGWPIPWTAPPIKMVTQAALDSNAILGIPLILGVGGNR